MNAEKKTTRTTLLLFILLILSIAGGLAIYFTTHAPVEMDNYVGLNADTRYPDGLDNYRRSLIYTGLAMTFLSFLVFIVSAASSKESAKDKILNYFLFLLIFALAWKSYAYWANGLHYVFSGGTSSLYDPKDLVPYIDIGVIWSAPVMFFHILIWLLVPVPIILAAINIRRERFNYKDTFTLIVIALLVLSFFITPNYMYWFLD